MSATDSVSSNASKVHITVRHEFQNFTPPQRASSVWTYRGVAEIRTDCSDMERPPIDLCLVLDVSGSMAGSKLQNLKAAAQEMVTLLSGDDVLSVVTYNSRPTTLIHRHSVSSAESKDLILLALEGMVAGGGTEIGAALQSALNVQNSEDLRTDGATRRTKRIFLYTDGQSTDNELAEQCQSILDEHNISISTFGIGNDVNGTLLESMAERGGGQYDFVTPRRVEELSRKALTGVFRLLACRGELRWNLRDGVALGVPKTLSSEQTVTEYVHAVGDIREENIQRIPFTLLMPPSAQRRIIDLADGQTVLQLGEVVLEFQPLDNPLIRTVREVPITLQFAHAEEAAAEGDPIVLIAFAMLEMSQANQHAVELLQRGTRDSVQEALQLLQEGLAKLRGLEQFDDENNFVQTAIRRGERTARRLRLHGVQDSSRVALELQWQSNTLDRQSLGQMCASESGNHSLVASLDCRGSPPPQFDGSADPPEGFHNNNMMRQFSDFQSGLRLSDDGSDVEDGLRLSPPGFHTPRRSSSPTLHAQMNPIQLPFALTLKAAAEEALPSDQRTIPAEFFCPITHELMTDPVTTFDGHTYEKLAIEKWFSEGNLTSPVTGVGLADLSLRPNMAIRAMLSNYK